MEGPVATVLLDGVRVFDLTGEVGLACGQLLADLGATVVHGEPPGGAPARTDPVAWTVHARNQHSVVVDLDTDHGRSAFGDVVRWCDVLVESRDLLLDEAGFGDAALVGLQPSIVVVAITPFGTFGPKQHYAATDLIVQAAAGNVALTGFSDRPPLCPAGVPAWSHAGAAAAGAALLGLRRARRTGQPSFIDVSAQEATSLTSSFSLLCEAIGGRRPGRMAPGAPGLGVTPCADGFVLNSVGAIGPTRRFTVRQAAWLADVGALAPDVAEAIAGGEFTGDTMKALGAAIGAWFSTRTKAELLDAAREHGFVLAPINTTLEALDSPQFAARDAWWHDGDATMPGPFARVEPPLTLRCPAPAVGEHDPAVFAMPAAHRRDAAADGDPTALPLAGVNVVDFGWVLAGPYAGRVLADYGATVVKVESDTRVDLLRLLGPQYDWGASPDNSASFGSSSAGKRSLVVDLTNPESRDVIVDLVRWADVVCDSFAPGAMERLGLDYDELRAMRPDVVVVSSSLFGQTGPYAQMPGYGLQGAAVSGLVLPTGYADRPPCGPYGPFTDYIAPRYQVLATLAALEHRDRTGEGTFVDIAQAETGLQAAAVALARASVDGTVLDREANTRGGLYPHGVYPSLGDDEWVAVDVRGEADWSSLCDVLGRRDLAGALPPDDIDAVISEWTAARDCHESERLLQAGGVPAHHVVTATSAPTDPHLVARRAFAPTTYGPRDVLVTSTGYHLSGCAARVGPIPRLGEHSVEVLRDLLGYAPDRVDHLVAAGVIGVAAPSSP